jgi:hypothetical protein
MQYPDSRARQGVQTFGNVSKMVQKIQGMTGCRSLDLMHRKTDDGFVNAGSH